MVAFAASVVLRCYNFSMVLFSKTYFKFIYAGGAV